MQTIRRIANVVAPALLVGTALGGCGTAVIVPALWGNVFVLGVTVAIFFGTLGLGRSADATRTADRSAPTITQS